MNVIEQLGDLSVEMATMIRLADDKQVFSEPAAIQAARTAEKIRQLSFEVREDQLRHLDHVIRSNVVWIHRGIAWA